MIGAWALASWRRYADVAAQRWALILAGGLLFAWIHSFPLQGPILAQSATAAAVDPSPLVFGFSTAMALGLVAAGALAYCRRQALAFFPLGVLPCLVITLILEWLPVAAWPALFVFLGLFSAPVVIAVADLIATSVLPSGRGHTVALGIALFNTVVYGVTLATQWTPAPPLLMATALLLAGVPLALGHYQRQIAGGTPVLAGGGAERSEVARLLFLWPLLPFIFGVTLVVGLMYGIVLPTFLEHGPLHLFYGVLPYIGLVFVAGAVADTRGRRIVAYAGALALGVGFILFGLLGGLLRHLVVHTLLMGGLAFINVFTWLVLADVALRLRAPLYYGVGLGIQVLALLLGMVFGEKFVRLTMGYEALTAQVAGLSLFLTLALLPALRETLKATPALAPTRVPDGLMGRFQDAGLTRRELEVARLLVEGASTREIEERLVIAPDTLKTHLRNIYRKMEVRDRRELALRMVEELHRVIQGLEDRLRQQG